MATAWPYTLYVCPCSDVNGNVPAPLSPTPSDANATPAVDSEEDGSYDPHSPRANYALYPLEHLLYCDECDAIRCPRCWTEEVINWFCPSCLFEVPSSAVKSDGNRCSRNCYNCPCCTSPLAVTAIDNSATDDFLRPGDAPSHETYILQCQYCDWSSLDADIQLSKPTKITEQLVRLRKSRGWKAPNTDAGENSTTVDSPALGHDGAFANLFSFYKEQMDELSGGSNPYSGSPYASPANLARIMSMYGGLSYNSLKKTRQKPQPMREADGLAEGVVIRELGGPDPDDAIIEKLTSLGWDGTASAAQQFYHPINNNTRFLDDLWPVATALRTRRGKRCRSCRQFLTRPDPKVGSMRYRIRLLALSFVPSFSVRSLQPSHPPVNPAFQLRIDDTTETELQRFVPQQYILTIRNPIFESVKVSLATPTVTPGKIESRVTILCPSFTVGPAGDVWEEALSTTGPGGEPSDGGRMAAMASLTGTSDNDRQPEAGKIWSRTRNSTSVILEVVPAGGQSTTASSDSDPDVEDSARLEIPIYVRVDWEAHLDDDVQGLKKKDGERRPAVPPANQASGPDTTVTKQLEYWCILGLGRIASS